MTRDEIKYEVSTLVPDHQFFTTTYKYSIVDEVPSALTLDTASIKVQKAGVNLTANTDYKLTVVDQKITVDFLKILTYTKGDKLTISYDAVLNNNATYEKHNVNTATLTYSNDPSDLSSTGTTSSSADIHTYYIELTKVAEENYNTVLTGAKFKLYRINGDTQVPLNLVQLEAGSYKVQVVADGSTANDLELVSKDGKLKVAGLGDGNYALVETVAPDGYKLPLDPFEFTITDTFATDGSSKLDGIAMENITTTNTFGKIIEPVGTVVAGTNGNDIGYITFKLTNAAGTPLPETGGIGTTLFTIGGLVLMAVALGFFTLQKKAIIK